MSEFFNFLWPALVFGLSVVFGFWLRKTGKPYNGVLFNVHKLLALGNVIFTGMMVFHLIENMHVPVGMVVLLVLVVLSVISLFASGALLSIGKLDHSLVSISHRISVAVLVLVMLLVVSKFDEML